MDQQYSSILLENAVNEFAKLPGIGRKTALRLVLHLLRQEEGEAEKFGNTIIKLCKEIKRCHICHNMWRPFARCLHVMRCRKCERGDGSREHSPIPRALSRIGGGHLPDGRHRSGRPRNRKFGRPSRLRWNKRGNTRTQRHDGRRHDQFLHIQEVGSVRC